MVTKARTGNVFPLLVLTLLAIPPCLPAQPAPPRIFFSDLESGPNSGGQNNNGVWVTIWDKGFGAERGRSTVTIGGGDKPGARSRAPWHCRIIRLFWVQASQQTKMRWRFRRARHLLAGRMRFPAERLDGWIGWEAKDRNAARLLGGVAGGQAQQAAEFLSVFLVSLGFDQEFNTVGR